MRKLIHFLFISLFLPACGQVDPSLKIVDSSGQNIEKSVVLIDPIGRTIETRFNVPSGFERLKVDSSSFEYYLRNLPLKENGSNVLYYNGQPKQNEEVYDAVVDLPIGNKDLHQCADAVMGLKAEYLWEQKRFSEIHFNLTNGFRVDYKDWMLGKRVIVEGNKTYWKKVSSASNTYQDFWKYLEFVFTYAGTLSLSKELIPINKDELKSGDVFIRGGSPGHAVIVLDVAIDPESKKKVFLLGQSYMPAQEIQILKNPNDNGLSPWYSDEFYDRLITPEWIFKSSEIMRFSY